MSVVQMISAVFGGSLFGSFLGPMFPEIFRRRSHTKVWEQPRLVILNEFFVQVEAPVIALDDRAIRCGCSPDQTRELLVRMGAVGTTMSNGKEGWCLDQNRMTFSTKNIDR